MKQIRTLIILFLCCGFCFCGHKTTLEEFLQYSEAFEKIGDYEGAIKSLKIAKFLHKDHPMIKKSLATMYNKMGRLEKSLPLTLELMALSPYDYKKHFNIIEDLCWAVLRNKALVEDLTYTSALQAALLTNDTRAIAMLVKALDSSNFYVRYAALKYACRVPDQIVQKCLANRLRVEKVEPLRLELCKALGQSRLKNAKAALEEVLSGNCFSSREKGYAMLSLCHLYPVLDSQALASLMHHKKPDFRSLSIHVLKKKKVTKAQEFLRTFLQDPVLQVRQSATNALLEFSNNLDKSLYAPLKKLGSTDHPSIAINVALVLSKCEKKQSQKNLYQLLQHSSDEIRNCAAYYLAKLCSDDKQMIQSILNESDDPFVRANFAVSLFEQGAREDIIVSEIEKILCDPALIQRKILNFCPAVILSCSSVNYTPQIQDYPKIQDISARLHLMSMLCVANSSKAMPLMKTFLKEKMWGVSASCAMLLIQEGGSGQVDLIEKLIDDEDQSISLQACLVLAFLKHDADLLLRLLKHYPDCSYPIKLTILEALGRLGDKNAIPFLLLRLQDPFQTTNIVAASSIIQCLYH